MSPADTKKDAPDLDALARDYMDLWQKHLAGLAGDEATADLMARTAQLINGPLADPATNPFLAAFTAASKAPDHDRPTTGTGSRAPAPATADGDSNDDVAELSRRIAVLEKRIAELEGGARPKRKPARKKTAKR